MSKRALRFFIYAALFVSLLPNVTHAQGEQVGRWVLVEAIDYDFAEQWAEMNKSPVYSYEPSYSGGTYSVTWTYKGESDNYYNPPVVHGESLAIQATWSAPPREIPAGQQVSLSLSIGVLANTQSFFAGSGSTSAYFDEANMPPGSISRNALRFVSPDGRDSFEVTKQGNYATVAETVVATPRAGGAEGDRMALIVSFFSFGRLGTGYVYEWEPAPPPVPETSPAGAAPATTEPPAVREEPPVVGDEPPAEATPDRTASTVSALAKAIAISLVSASLAAVATAGSRLGGLGASPHSLVELIDKIWGAGGEQGYQKLVNSLHQALSRRMDDLYQTSAKLGHSKATATVLRRANTLTKTVRTLKAMGRGMSMGLSWGGIGLDALENMQDLNREDGSLIAGDGLLTAAGKSVMANAVLTRVLEANPAVAVMEAATFATLGDTQAGGIVSPVTSMKGAMNMAMDAALDPRKAIDRASAGAYGENLKNTVEAARLSQEALDDPAKFFAELGQVGNDADFYRNMQETASTMWRDEDGNVGYVGAAGEAVTQMGVAITQTAAEMAKAAGHVAGTLFERASLSINRFFD